jgi:hypothetical protein
MLESTVDLLDGIFSIAVILLMVSCIVGSTVAALRAVGRGTATSTRNPRKFVHGVGNRSEGLLDAKCQVQSGDSVLQPDGVRESPISHAKPDHISPTR